MWIQEEGQSGNDSNDDESPDISKWESIIWLSVMTAWISILSEYLVGAIEVDNIHIFTFNVLKLENTWWSSFQLFEILSVIFSAQLFI